MENQHYTLNEISIITGFTERTLRTYIKDGLLNGVKKKNKWLFTEENLQQFLSQDFIVQGLKIKDNIVVKDFMENVKTNVPKACLVYDFPGEDSKIFEMCTKLTNFLQENHMMNFQFRFHYDDQCHVGRFIFTGDLSRTKEIIELLACS